MDRASNQPPGYPLDHLPPNVQQSASALSWTNVPQAHVDGSAQNAPKKRSLIGCKRGLIGYAIATAIIFLFNIIWLIYARVQHGINGGIGTIRRGRCDGVEKLDSDLHLVINILSTIVLTASTTFMALAYSPSRAEVDIAHEKMKCLSVGALGFRNIWHISWTKALLYLLLMLTSAPFHLLANSAVFTTLSANGYKWAVVSEQFVADTNSTQPFNSSTPLSPEDLNSFKFMQSNLSSYKTLSNEECVDAYSDIYQNKHRTVLVVVANVPKPVKDRNTSQIFQHGTSFAGNDANNWICSRHQSDRIPRGQRCDTTPSSRLPFLGIEKWADWEVFNQTALHCLSEERETACAVQYSAVVVGLLIMFTFFKLAGMVFILVLFFNSKDRPLACPGDAAESFLRSEDPTTIGMCLATRKGVKKVWRKRHAKVFKDRLLRSWRGASIHVWLYFVSSVLTIMFFALIYILGTVLSANKSGREYHFFRNFGKVNSDLHPINPGTPQRGVLDVAVMANSPQFVLAFFWVIYQGLFSSMAHARDWARFALQSETLMVSSPRGRQRGLWFFGMPMYAGIPLFLLQTLTHWLVSQSIFAVRIETYDDAGNVDRDHLVSTIGVSPVAMLCVFFVSAFLLWLILHIGLLRMPSKAPVVGMCSAAISAACHSNPRNNGMECEPLKWGVTSDRHCALASEREVYDSPTHGLEYS